MKPTTMTRITIVTWVVSAAKFLQNTEVDDTIKDASKWLFQWLQKKFPKHSEQYKITDVENSPDKAEAIKAIAKMILDVQEGDQSLYAALQEQIKQFSKIVSEKMPQVAAEIESQIKDSKNVGISSFKDISTSGGLSSSIKIDNLDKTHDEIEDANDKLEDENDELEDENDELEDENDGIEDRNRKIVWERRPLEQIEEYSRYEEQLHLEKESTSEKERVAASRKIEKSQKTTIEQEIKNLKAGWLYFNPKQKMKIGVKERVYAEIARDIKQIKDELSKEEYIQTIKISPVMKLNLKGKYFEIFNMNNDDQIMKFDESTIWNWDVIPVRTGNLTLTLLITVKLNLPDYGNEYMDHLLDEKNIIVKVNPTYSVKKFFKDNWQWVIGTLVGSGLIFSLLKALGIFK